MKKLITICAVVTMVLAVSTANASIRDQAGYYASTGLNLGAWDSSYLGVEGYVIADPFQINLEYQTGVANADIDALNAYDPTGGWTANFSDNDEYVLTIDEGGDLPLYTYNPGTPTSVAGGADIQWTITGWYQTILAGDIVDHGGSISLRVLPYATYRPFDGDAGVNSVEVFDSPLDCEVIAYTFAGTAAEIGDGSSLGVELVPEPATMSLLAIGGLAVLRRRRRRRS